MRRDHDWGFFQWFGVGFLIVFGFITGFSIGLPFFFAGIVLLAQLAVREPHWTSPLGFLAGAGGVSLVIASINARNGGLDPTWWFATGAGLTVAPTFLFWWLRCRPVLSS